MRTSEPESRVVPPKPASTQSRGEFREDGWLRATRALRASGWWYFGALPLITLAGEPLSAEPLPRVMGAAIVAALCLSYAYGLNGITDRNLDLDQSKNSLAGLSEVPREAAL